MPARNTPKTPQHKIDEAVKRFMAGEPVSTLAKYYKVSRPGFYLWVKKYKESVMDAIEHHGLTPKESEKLDKQTLLAERDALKAENAKLRNKVVSLMIKSGEM